MTGSKFYFPAMCTQVNKADFHIMAGEKAEVTSLKVIQFALTHHVIDVEKMKCVIKRRTAKKV